MSRFKNHPTATKELVDVPSLGFPELMIILVVIALLFGASRLPKLARSVGQSAKEFRKGLEGVEDEDDEDQPKSKKEKKAKTSVPSDSESPSDDD